MDRRAHTGDPAASASQARQGSLRPQSGAKTPRRRLVRSRHPVGSTDSPQRWIHTGAGRWALSNGAALGIGAGSRLGFWLWYVIPLASFLSGSVAAGAAMWGTYGLVRGAAAWVMLLAAGDRDADGLALWLIRHNPAARRRRRPARAPRRGSNLDGWAVATWPRSPRLLWPVRPSSFPAGCGASGDSGDRQSARRPVLSTPSAAALPTVSCTDAVRPGPPDGVRQDDLVVGPVQLMGGRTWASEPPRELSPRRGRQYVAKVPVVLAPGGTATLVVGRRQRQRAALVYREQTRRAKRTGAADRAVRFVACPDQSTAWPGGVIVVGPICLGLEVRAPGRAPARRRIAFGRGSCPQQ